MNICFFLYFDLGVNDARLQYNLPRINIQGNNNAQNRGLCCLYRFTKKKKKTIIMIPLLNYGLYLKKPT